MPQLPSASADEGDELSNTPPHGPRVGRLAQAPKLGLPLPLEHLFPPDIRQPRVKILDLARQILDMLPLALLVHLGFPDGDIEVHAHLRGGEPPAGVVGAEADGVVPCFVRGEGEFALGESTRVDDLVAAVDFLLDCRTGSVTRA